MKMRESGGRVVGGREREAWRERVDGDEMAAQQQQQLWRGQTRFREEQVSATAIRRRGRQGEGGREDGRGEMLK
jgi:hypothetical protein